MNIKVDRSNRDYTDILETTVAGTIQDHMESSDGQVDSLEHRLYKTQSVLANLIQYLVVKNILTIDEIQEFSLGEIINDNPTL